MALAPVNPLTSPALFARRLLGFNLHEGQNQFVECRAQIASANTVFWNARNSIPG